MALENQKNSKDQGYIFPLILEVSISKLIMQGLKLWLERDKHFDTKVRFVGLLWIFCSFNVHNIKLDKLSRANLIMHQLHIFAVLPLFIESNLRRFEENSIFVYKKFE